MKRLKMTIFFCTLVTMLVTLLMRTGWAEAALAAGSSCGSWSIVSSPSPGAGNDNLMGVAITSASDVWAVGSNLVGNGPNSTYQTLTEHWNGSQWSVVQTPNIGSGGDYFQGIAADSANDIWTVGAYVDVANHQQLTMIQHCC